MLKHTQSSLRLLSPSFSSLLAVTSCFVDDGQFQFPVTTVECVNRETVCSLALVLRVLQ